MKCTNKKNLFFVLFACFLITAGIAAYVLFFRSHEATLQLPFDKTNTTFGFEKVPLEDGLSVSFAADLCVARNDVPLDGLSLMAASAGLFDETNKEVIYAKALHEKRYPASLTKIMTALVAIKYGNLDDIVTVGEECKNIEMGSSVAEIHVGDQLSLRKLLYGLMINSGNDAAMTIALHIGGSVDGFVDLMNKEAARIGATNTHFTNTHGLQDENHYTTAYDTYLMFHEAIKNEEFLEMIHKHSYYAEFKDALGEDRGVMWESTNHYFINQATPPSNVLVFGGKTGTTDLAGACLILYSMDKYGDPFIAIIMKEDSKDLLYQEMNELLSKINK